MSRKRIEEINKEICDLEIEKIKCEKNLYVTCKGSYKNECGARKKVRNLIVFRGEYYTPTYGCCEGGDLMYYTYLQYICSSCGEICSVHEGDFLYDSVFSHSKKRFNYEDLNKGDVVRKKQFKDIIEEWELKKS